MSGIGVGSLASKGHVPLDAADPGNRADAVVEAGKLALALLLEFVGRAPEDGVAPERLARMSLWIIAVTLASSLQSSASTAARRSGITP